MKQFRGPFFLLFVIVIICIGIIGILKLEISENLDATIPGSGAFQEISPWLDQNKRTIVFSLTVDPQTNSLDEIRELGDSLLKKITHKSEGSITSTSYESDIDPDDFIDYFYTHLPLYLNDLDYLKIDSLISAEVINATLKENKEKILSPEGFGIKKILIKDPLHLLNFAFNKIPDFGSEEIINSEGLFLSKDRKKLFIKGRLAYNPSNSKKNELLSSRLLNLQQEWNQEFGDNPVSFFGLFLIADANAKQIKKDVILTVSIAILFIVALLIYYYRKLIVLALFLLPGVFGVLFAIGAIYLFQGEISGLAFGASAIIFGIVADYSFHYFSQFRETNDAFKTRNNIAFPLIMSSATTIIAFLSLIFADSQALHDFGLFTSLSLAGTLFFVLTIVPYLLRPFENKIVFANESYLDKFLNKIEIDDEKAKPWVLVIIALSTAVLFYFALDIKFENDLNKLNFYPENLKRAELELQNIDPDKQKRINMLVSDGTPEKALEINHIVFEKLLTVKEKYNLKEINSLGTFLVPKSEQILRLNKWESFWASRRYSTIHDFKEAAVKTGFNTEAYQPFYALIREPHKVQDLYPFIRQSQTLSQLLIEDENTNIITSIVCDKQEENKIRTMLSGIDGLTLVDGESIISVLISAVKADFNYLLTFASIAVFLTMLIIYGSLELTLVSFLPMVISWIWILGIASILDIKFNFINIILATFIFGLGDDFSIFITDGLQKKYKYKEKVLGHYKTGILLSSITTIVGTGVLLFAEHPALKSIALLSVIGICTIVFISFLVQPILFRFFVTARVQNGKPPMTLFGIAMSFFGFGAFIIGSLLCVFFSYVIRIIPFVSTKKKKYLTHLLLQKTTGMEMDILFNVNKRYFGLENLDFDKPSILIANHSSFEDILTLVRLHPKMVLMVNRWVYDSPLFGEVVKYCDYLPAFDGYEDNLDKIEKMISQGYSIAIYPEGKRSVDGKLRRFHKGAFYLSEKLQLDITPIMLNGFSYIMPKHDFYLKNGFADVTVLPRISWDDTTFGSGYKERTKKIKNYFSTEFNKYLQNPQQVDYAFDPLLGIYRYKGPILEWYFRVKWKFEKANYETYNQLIGPGQKTIYDLGCGYGFLSYFLLIRNDERIIKGIDYDEEKIKVAQSAYLKNNKIDFITLNIEDVIPENADVIILADVLHYLSDSAQLRVLQNCKKGLKENGIILIRDGLKNEIDEHKWTKKSEKWSTKLTRFNKTEGDLNFFDQSFINNWAENNEFKLKIISRSSKSSNTLILLSSLPN